MMHRRVEDFFFRPGNPERAILFARVFLPPIRERGNANASDDTCCPISMAPLETSRARDAFKADLLNIVVKAADKEARHAEWLLERYWPNEFGRSEPREIIYVHEPAPLPVQSQSPEVRTETRWTKGEIPFSKAQLKYLSDVRGIANNGGDADAR
jgi:hypothetical protein